MLEHSRSFVIAGVLYYENPDVPGTLHVVEEHHSRKFASHSAEHQVRSTGGPEWNADGCL